MKGTISLIAMVSVLLGCSRHNQQNGLKDIPDCIRQKVDDIRAQPKWNPPAEVNEYEYQGKQVYLFSSPCCDQHNILYDKNCNRLCAPSGGYTGRGDGKCSDFSETARHIRLVWKDER